MAKNKKKNDNKVKKNFFKDFKAELKRVIWPTPKQLVNNTVAVIVIVLITAVIVFALDLIFEIVNKQGINRVKDFVESHKPQDSNNEANDAIDNILNAENSNNEAENNTVNE